MKLDNKAEIFMNLNGAEGMLLQPSRTTYIIKLSTFGLNFGIIITVYILCNIRGDSLYKYLCDMR